MILKKMNFRNVKNDHEIKFQKTFQHSFLTKTKLRHVELKILSSDVVKCEKRSRDFSLEVVLEAAKIKIKKLLFLLSLRTFFSEFTYNINRENMKRYEYDLASNTCRAN